MDTTKTPHYSDGDAVLLRGEQSIIMSELIDRLNLTDGDKRRLRRDYGDLIDAIGNTSGGAEALVAAGNDPANLKALAKNRAAVIFDTRRTAIFKSAIINTVNRELTPVWREEQVAIMDGFIDRLNLTNGDKRWLRRNFNLIGILENSKSGAAALAEARADPAALLALLKSRAGRIFDTRGTKKYVDAINSL
jgi:hypothetical protein